MANLLQHTKCLVVRRPLPSSLSNISQQARRRHRYTIPPASHFSPGLRRFNRYDERSEEITDLKLRNPLNYVEMERQRLKHNAYWKRRMMLAGFGLVCMLGFQAYAIYFWGPDVLKQIEESKEKVEKEKAAQAEKELQQESLSTGSVFGTVNKLDAKPGHGMNGSQAVRIVQTKPGDPHVKLDQDGNELVETGTSSIPHFPRKIRIASSNAAPAAQSASPEPGVEAQAGMEEYNLLGLGIRTVSFLSIQVYVLGMYVRTSDLDKLQAAFVNHVNPLGSSLIPSEKETLKRDLLSAEESLEIWNKVLLETGVRSIIRVVPVRGTDFAHLRDGWVRGITARTQEASRKSEGKSEFDEPGFGESMGNFKQMMGGKGSAPKGSVLLLTRDEKGKLGLIFEGKKGSKDGLSLEGEGAVMGDVEDERISRQVWLGYLGGKNVSSEGARKSIVDGVMDLVERPIGTLGTQVS